MRMSPRIFALLVSALSLGLWGAGELTSPTPAAAHTGPGPATGGGQWHPWPSDGCTKVLNWIPGVFNFTHACQHHDGCYVNHWAAKNTCDGWFFNDMIASCGTSSTLLVNRPSCYSWASTYWAGVQLCGNYSYNNRSVSTPMGNLCW